MCFNVSHTAAWDSFQFSYKPISESCAKEFYNERSVKMNANTRSNISNVCLKLENSFRPIVHSPSSSYIENHIAICAVNALFSIVGTILNSLVLYIFWKSQQWRSKMFSFVIMMLCSIDLGVVTIVQPLFISFLINEILETSKLCLILIAFVLLASLFHAMSASTLLTINMQRNLSIVRPIFHRTFATKKRFLLTSLFIWFIYILSYLSRILVVNYGWIGTAVLIFIFCCTIFYCYLSIFLVARKRLPRANQVNIRSDQDNSTNLVSLLCHLPYSIVLVCCKLETVALNERTIVAIDWTFTLLFINSTFNCCVFFWTNRELRKESVKIVRKCFGERYCC